ncbi:MAG: IgGFc-binding protein [Ignavibacteriae bacterium]|nr:IgGFc-binding protein [Ignavibacteriota bacterium]
MIKRFFFATALVLALLVFMSNITSAGDFDLKNFKKKLPALLGSNNVGTDFWLTFNPCWETSGAKNDLKLYISSGVETTVTVEIPGKGYLRQQKTVPNDIIEITLTPALGQCYRKTDRQSPEPDQVFAGMGVHVFADQPIIVYGVTRYQYTSDSYLGLPVSSLGKDYVVASWQDISDFGNQYLPCYTAIVSPYDNNRVRFTMGGTSSSRTAGGQQPGETKTYNMYKGDVLLISSYGQRADLSGSRIKSTKPVSVISSNFCAYVPENTPACDYMMEMELPTNTWVTEYHYTPIFGRLRNSIIKIFTKEPGTQISMDGVPLTTLKTGAGMEDDGWLRMRADVGAPRPIVFSGNKPIYVEMFNCGQLDDNVSSDPFMLILTPLEQYQREIIFNTPGIKGGFGFALNYINLVYRALDDGSLPDDLEFATVQGGNFVWKKLRDIDPKAGQPFNIPINGKKYYNKTIKLPADGVYKIRANDPFAAYAYGFSSFDSYGHPTSVALGDLEKPDTLPPDPKWEMLCDGTIEGAIVEDMPRNNDRSNLSMVLFDPEASFNFKFSYEDFIPGEDAFTHWQAYVFDKSKDARAVITFIDRRGNDTTIVIDYYAIKLTVRPGLDFGRLAIGQTKQMDVWLINESKQSDALATKLQLKNNNQGFQINGITLPVLVPKNDSIKFQVQFTASVNGEFKDSIGVGDTCVFAYKALVKAEVGSAIINVSYHDYGDVPIKTSANGTIEIRNLGNIDLVVTGYTGPSQPAIYIPDLNIDPAAPLVLSPNAVYTYEVRFLPLDTIVYTDSMFFISNSEKVGVDSVGELIGRGIEPNLVANSYDWGRKRIDRAQFPAGPYDPDNGYEVIKLENGGTMDVTIYNVREESNINGTAFEFDRGLLTNRVIKPKEFIIVPVKFHPTVTGQHELVLTYDNSANSGTKTTLRGIGIVPQTFTADVDFGSTILQDYSNPSIKQVRFTNKTPIDWAYGDSVTITDFSVLPNGTEISTNSANWGTEGFQYDKSKLTFPIKLAQGEYIEFDAAFVADKVAQSTASLSSVSDAQNEVTSNWTGTGIAQGITVTTDVIQTCVSHPDIITCTISNTGSSDLTVDSILIQPLDQASNGEFEFVNPNDSAGFSVGAGLFKTVDIRYKAIPNAGTKIPDISTHQANLVAYNNSIFTPIAVSQTPMVGTCEHHYLDAKVGIATPTALIGDVVNASITLDPNADISLANIKSLDVEIKYNGDFLKVEQGDIQIEGVMKNQFTISNLKINDVSGTIRFTLSSPTNIFNYPAGGELIAFKIGTYLPKGSDSTSPVTFTIATNEPCVDISTTPSRIAIAPTCVFDLRKVVMSNTSYGLQSINPNPVSNNNAEINFSVGLKGYTEIKIYNSSTELVAMPVKEELEIGLYKINLDVSNMPNGVYWYEMTSGPYHSIEKMVIAR